MSDSKIQLLIEGIWIIHWNAYKVLLTKYVVNIKYRPAGKKTANIIFNNYSSSSCGVYEPDCIYETAKMIQQNIQTKLKWTVVV